MQRCGSPHSCRRSRLPWPCPGTARCWHIAQFSSHCAHLKMTKLPVKCISFCLITLFTTDLLPWFPFSWMTPSWEQTQFILTKHLQDIIISCQKSCNLYLRFTLTSTVQRCMIVVIVHSLLDPRSRFSAPASGAFCTFSFEHYCWCLSFIITPGVTLAITKMLTVVQFNVPWLFSLCQLSICYISSPKIDKIYIWKYV